MTSDAWELPTYGEATGTVDCWAIVAPYVPPSAYTSLCLTSSKLYGHFAARLWNNPLRAVQFLGLDRNDGEERISSTPARHYAGHPCP